MKGLEELDHYELLELPRGARAEEIDRAYTIVRAAYDSDSLALYSVFSRGDSAAIRERIDYAYSVLSDPRSRGAYDNELGIETPAPAPARSVAAAAQPAAAPPPAPAAQPTASSDAAPTANFDAAHPKFEASEPPLPLDATRETYEELEDEESGDYDGAKLRRARMRAGVELDEISQITKVNPRHLANLESENFDELPDIVYVRGYVVAYARALHLDAPTVSRSYMARIEAHRSAPPRSRLLSRQR